MIKNVFIFILMTFMVAGFNRSEGTDRKIDYKKKQAETIKKLSVSSAVKDNKIKITVRNASYPIEDPGGNNLSKYYELRDRQIVIPLNQTALILIDTWDIENPRLQNSRLIDITKEIKSILNIARELDMIVVYSPHRSIGWEGLSQKTDTEDLRGNADTPRSKVPESEKSVKTYKNQWPPLEFTYRVGEYSTYSTYSNPSYIPYTRVLGINKELLPQKRGREFIESKFSNVQKIFNDNKILHLLYVGEATNKCILHRPVGIRHMSSLGYNTIIVRGATVGTELNSTYKSQQVTKAAILDIEINYGFSVSKDNLLKALESIRDSK